MPQGQAHFLPSGFWDKEPTSQKKGVIARCMLKTAKNFLILYALYECFHHFRKFGWTYTYPNFVGNTRLYGDFTVRDHKPATVEEIDRLVAEERLKKAESRKS